MRYRITPPPVSPAGRIAAALVSIVVLAGALAFGFMVLLVALGFLAVLGIYAWFRARWPGRGNPPRAGARRRARGAADIEGEYTVISRRRD